MIVGDATIGNTTVGFSTTQVDLSLSSTATTTAALTTNLGKAVSLSSTATSNVVINRKVNLSTSPTASGTATFNSLKGVNLSFDVIGPQVGDFAIGDSVIGATLGEPTATQTEAIFNSSKGITQSLSSTANSSLTVFKKINLALSAAASASADFANFKGVNVQFQSTAQGTAVFIPDYDEIIGRTRADGEIDNVERADGERVFILQAEGNID